MKIIVPVKQVPDELAIQLREKQGGSVTVISMGPAKAEAAVISSGGT